MAVPDVSASTGRTTVTTVAHANPLFMYDAPLIRIAVTGEPDAVTAAIARQVDESGRVFLELPDGRVALILDLSGGSWSAGTGGDGGWDQRVVRWRH
jgi:hypothetical protein